MTTQLTPEAVDQHRATITRALNEIRELRSELASRPPQPSPVVVASAACRLPGANSPEEFWQLLNSGAATDTPVPQDRWDNDAVFDAKPGRRGRTYAGRASFLDDPFGFDPLPFGISPREAQNIDPHHRLVLTCAWEALERAGVSPTGLRGTRTGVFVGMSGNDYERRRLTSTSLGDLDGLSSMGSSVNFAANRLSYLLGLQGPSLVVDTACSSSLVALHLAHQSLANDECDLAIVAGVNVMLSAEAMVALSQSRMLSPTNRCHTFSTAADGYARGEGCVTMVLRRADDTQDHVEPLGSLLASVGNQDGPTSGITVPNGQAQRKLHQTALRQAGVQAADVSYVEAHGTGTALGDPIELRALADAYSNRDQARPLLVGATKPVTGHLEGAAGLVGLLKSLLVVNHRSVPAQPLDGDLSAGVDWTKMPLRVPTSQVALQDEHPIAGVSSFGYGGTNAHALVRRWDSHQAPETSRQRGLPFTLRISGATQEAVTATARRYIRHLEDHGPSTAGAMCARAIIGQADLKVRASLVADAPNDLLAGLRAIVEGNPHPTHIPSQPAVADPTGAPRAGDLHQLTTIVPHLAQLAEEAAGEAPPAAASLWAATTDPHTIEDPHARNYHRDVVAAALTHLGVATPETLAVESQRDPQAGTGAHTPPLVERVIRALHEAWLAGTAVRWSALYLGQLTGPPLPTYPWQTASLVTPILSTAARASVASELNLRIRRTGPTSAEAIAEIDPQSLRVLHEHVVYGHLVLPGVVVTELALRLAEAVVGETLSMNALELSRPCIIKDGDTTTLRLVWDGSTSPHTILLSSEGDSDWHHHATATLVESPEGPNPGTFHGMPDPGGPPLDRDAFYDQLWPTDFTIGPSLALVDQAEPVDGGWCARLASPPQSCAGLSAGIRPEVLVLDAAVQIAAATRSDRSDGVLTLGAGFRDLQIVAGADMSTGATVHATRTGEGEARLEIRQPDGAPAAVISGVVNAPVDRAQLDRLSQAMRTTSLTVDPEVGAEGLVKGAIATVLGIAADSVQPEARLEDLMDSIMLVELGELLVDHTDAPVAVPDLLDCGTVGNLITSLHAPTTPEPSQAPVTSFDPPLRKRELTVEAMVDLAASHDLPTVDVVPRSELPPGVLLTGGTGFVGTFLLHELLRVTARPIHCLVRADDLQHAWSRLHESARRYGLASNQLDERVIPVVGDLVQDNFGLDKAGIEQLHQSVGEIFHNAGTVKWTSSYEKLSPHNVDGTARVLAFATRGPARPVHFTSTVGVFSSDRVDLGAADENLPLTNSGPLVVGYAQTKWVSEMMVRRAGARGLPFTIHRINTGPAPTVGGFNRLDHLSLIIKGCIESGLAPSDGPFPVQSAPVDDVARAYVQLALDPRFEGRTSHLVNEPLMRWSEFFEHAADFGFPLTRLPFPEWRTAVTGRRSGTLALLGLAPFLTRTIDDVNLADFTTPETQLALGGDEPWCRPLDRDLVHTFLDGFVQGEFFPPPTR